MDNTTQTQDKLSSAAEMQIIATITKKIIFEKETLRNLVTIASREYFESKLKQDEILSLMLNKIINEYYNQYWTK